MNFGEIQKAASSPRKALLRAYTVVEVLVSVCVLGIMLVSLYGGFSAGFAVVQVARENMRATQIMVQRIETMRLYNWDQILKTNNFLKSTFTDRYDPSSSVGGTYYRGFVSTNAPILPGAAYTNNIRTVLITLYWTNYPQKQAPIVRRRQMETHVARYGMQNYLYQ